MAVLGDMSTMMKMGMEFPHMIKFYCERLVFLMDVSKVAVSNKDQND